MRKLLLAFAAAGALSLPSAAARADTVVYNGGDPNQFGTFFADSALPAAVYISFVLPAGVTSINDAEWWGGCYGSSAGTCGTSPSFTISVLTSTDTGPGTVIATDNVGGADQTATGNLITGVPPSFLEYVYNADFPAISLSPGTTYFFEITGTTGADETGFFGVENTSNAPEGAVAYQSIGGATPTLIGPEALKLTAVPEPSTWGMMLLGFAGLGYLGYRKRAALAVA
jgi:hypothetical protein